MELQKAQWATDQNRVSLTTPIVKVDQERRLVSGFATLDNLDTGDDVVLAEASAAAFSRFRGNIREMHQPIAAGHLVSFAERDFYDEEGNLYNGIFVTAYVSKGAQDTWEKVLDGTLSGFSIGGSINKSRSEYVSESDKTIRYIEDYDLVELSLVDSPANQLANIFSIEKAADGNTFIKGMAVDTKAENIFFCTEDTIAITSSEDNTNCSVCGDSMKNIGWVESNDPQRTEKIRSTIKFALNKNANILDEEKTSTTNPAVTYNISVNSMSDAEEIAKQVQAVLLRKEGVDVAEDTTNKNAAGSAAPEETVADEQGKPKTEVESSVDNTEVSADEATTESEPVQAADNDEVEQPDVTKMLEDLRKAVDEGLKSTTDATKEEVTKVRDQVEEINKSIDNKIAEVTEKYSSLKEEIDSLRGGIEGVEKRLETVSDGTAVKKSGDLGGSTERKEQVTKGIWGGRFTGSYLSDLENE